MLFLKLNVIINQFCMSVSFIRRYNLSIKWNMDLYKNIQDLKIGVGNSFRIGMGKLEIALKIVTWNAKSGNNNRFVIIILFLHSNDTYLWKNIITVLHYKNKYFHNRREILDLDSHVSRVLFLFLRFYFLDYIQKIR